MTKSLTIKIWIILFLTLLFQTSYSGSSGGTVKLNNYTNEDLIVFVQSTDSFGYTRWKKVDKTLYARTYLLLLDVPNGTIIGAQTINKSITFEPLAVRYSGNRYFEIDFQ